MNLKRLPKFIPFGLNAEEGIKNFDSDVFIDPHNPQNIVNDIYTKGFEEVSEINEENLTSVLFYLGKSLEYLYQKGVAQFSPYEHYYTGDVVNLNGELYIARTDIAPSQKIPKMGGYNGKTPYVDQHCTQHIINSGLNGKNNAVSVPVDAIKLELPYWDKLVTQSSFKALEQRIEALENA